MSKFFKHEAFLFAHTALPLKAGHFQKDNKATYDIKLISEHSHELLNKYLHYRSDVKNDVLEDWLNNGYVCLLAVDSHEIFGDLWISTKKSAFPYINVLPTTFQGKGYIYNIFVKPERRRHGVASFLIFKACEYIHTMGLESAWAAIYVSNKPSINMFAQLNFSIMHRFDYFYSKFLKKSFLRKIKD